MRDERGFTVIELMITTALGTALALVVFTMVDVSMSNTASVAARVDANQRARPVMTRLMDELHSACVAANSAPILAGSHDNSISFHHQTGAAVSPVPEKHTVTVASGNLSQAEYASTGGTPPNWTFSSTPASNQVLLTGVQQAELDPGGLVPVFRYYAESGGSISTTPLPVPLSSADAKRVIQVVVAFGVKPNSAANGEEEAVISLTDSAVFRFSPFSEDPTKANGPCA
jgi:prepilin-type N-terminal cleavage/methylation domain-containing protein